MAKQVSQFDEYKGKPVDMAKLKAWDLWEPAGVSGQTFRCRFSSRPADCDADVRLTLRVRKGVISSVAFKAYSIVVAPPRAFLTPLNWTHLHELDLAEAQRKIQAVLSPDADVQPVDPSRNGCEAVKTCHKEKAHE